MGKLSLIEVGQFKLTGKASPHLGQQYLASRAEMKYGSWPLHDPGFGFLIMFVFLAAR